MISKIESTANPHFVKLVISAEFPTFLETKGKPAALVSNKTKGEHSILEVNRNASDEKNAFTVSLREIFFKKTTFLLLEKKLIIFDIPFNKKKYIDLFKNKLFPIKTKDTFLVFNSSKTTIDKSCPFMKL